MNTLDVGRFGEDSAAIFLKKNGYRIVERNIHVSHNEIDIIARDKNYLVFVEVKTLRRKGMFRPLDNLSMVQIKRNSRAARSYWRSLGNPELATRFDLIEVVLSRWGVCDIRHHYGYQMPLTEQYDFPAWSVED